VVPARGVVMTEALILLFSDLLPRKLSKVQIKMGNRYPFHRAFGAPMLPTLTAQIQYQWSDYTYHGTQKKPIENCKNVTLSGLVERS
jgi:hypothetical protein